MKKVFNLTKRELEVLKMYDKGYTTGEISKKLGISKKTGENHNRNLRMKLHDSKSIVKALSVARKFGLLD